MPFWNPGDEITADKLNTGHVIQDFVFGESINVNDAVYLASDGKVYRTNASYNDERIQNFIGFAKESGNANDIKKVQIGGIIEGFSGLIPGVYYYLSNTPGAISSDIGTYVYGVGMAISSTKLLMLRNYPIVLPSDEVQHTNDNEKSAASNYFVKVKEIRVDTPFILSRIRIKFEGKDPTSDDPAYASYFRIGKNDTFIGEEMWTDNNPEWIQFAQDLGPFKQNDLIQLYVRSNHGQPTYVRNFRLCYSMYFTAWKGFTNTLT